LEAVDAATRRAARDIHTQIHATADPCDAVLADLRANPALGQGVLDRPRSFDGSGAPTNRSY
jgi:hypothetical protein